MSTTVEVDNLTKRFGDVEAVSAVNLRFAPGKVTAVLGPSGCGKTTTLKIIVGLLAPTFGDVLFDGRSMVHTKAEKRGAVMVFQSHLLFPYMSVQDNVGFGLRMRGVSKKEMWVRSCEMLERVGLGGLETRRPHQLSGGQQQRVALARALVVEPKVLLLDEPLSNLDAHLREDMRLLIAKIQQDLGLTTIVVTHDQQEAVVLADRIALMLDGRLEQVGSPEDFYARPRTESVARFFRCRNLVRGELEDGVVKTSLGRLQVAGGCVTHGEALVAFRPNALHLDPVVGCNEFEAVVKELVFLGDTIQVILAAGDQSLEMVLESGDVGRVQLGERVKVGVSPHSAWAVLPDFGVPGTDASALVADPEVETT